MTDQGSARVLCDVDALVADGSVPGGAAWRLAEPARQLDANLVRIPPGGHIPAHVEPHLDVLVLVVAGDGTLDSDSAGSAPQPLTPGSLVWLPHGSTRGLTAGESGMSYLTVHRRRPGMQIQARPGA
ncbi:cupin domain-containing protein [Streptomyces sp. NPDC053367]|uniref:cupin domain-containing protein n=1 Tax=Streptomyces sp. NPDC053367 TaxID=3365700 RepID=UPI0037CF45D9